MFPTLPDTAPLSIRTGLPGSGKTLRTVEEMVKLVEQGVPVFASNFVELSVPGVLPWEDPCKWQELPPGAVLYVDEAQAFFPPRGGTEKPQYISAFSTVRHTGVRVVMITQMPSLLHKHVREVSGAHEHLLRDEGKERALVFRWAEVQDDPKSRGARQRADHETFVYPSELYGLYKSAELHVIKRRIPRRKLIAYAMLVGAVVLAGLGFLPPLLASRESVQQEAPPRQSVQQKPASASAPLTQTSKRRPLSTLEYVQQRVPRVPEEPWSAPLFDGRPAVTDPRVFCMSTATSCRCVTEQNTPYSLREASCRHIARHGEPYNPYRSAAPEPAASGAPPGPASPQGMGPGGHVAAGGFGRLDQ